jgi:ABC-type multidrug transport system ATPase subunit
MSANQNVSVAVRDLTKRLGTVTVLRKLNLDLGPGAVCGIVGANGSGKSTLLRLLSGELTPDSGTITLCGQPLVKRRWFTSRDDARRYVAYLPDQNEALTELTGYEFLRLHYCLRGITPGTTESEIEQALGLDDFAGRRLSVLSQGQRKRILIAGSLAGTPPVWLLDEPTNALDQDTCNYLTRVVNSRRDAGLITIAVTHDAHVLSEWNATVTSIESLQSR